MNIRSAWVAISHSTLLMALCAALGIAGCEYTLVEEPAVAGKPVIRISISPGTATPEVTETQQFTATVSGSTNKAVIWSIASGPGTIDSTGLYQAPLSYPTGADTATIRAVAKADTTASAVATVIIRIPPYMGVCFQREVLPIFNSKCSNTNCHDKGTHKDDWILSRYTDTTIKGNAYRGIQSLSLEEFLHGLTLTGDDRMPPEDVPQLTQAEIDTIVKWYNEGARPTTCSGNLLVCDTNNVTYSGTIRPIIESKCIGCHYEATPLNSDTDLARYDSIFVLAMNGNLMASIDHRGSVVAMPQDIDQLPDCLIRQFRAWVNKGAPNN
jgi:hypothetical protein